MPAYIISSSTISPQGDINAGNIPLEPQIYDGNRLKSVDPDYKDYIPAAMLRRMGRVLKLGVGAGLICLKRSSIEIPDGIITGTGLGCIEDSENFLISIKENKENFLTPTPFIQSTHNSISGQIALFTKCHHYNFTFVHRSFSFESALLDSMMRLNEKKAPQHFLVGSADELTDRLFIILQRLGYWKQNCNNNNSLIPSTTKGTIAGEGASFFLLSNVKSNESCVEVSDVSMFYKPKNLSIIKDKIESFLFKNKLTLADIDVVLTGINGDITNDAIYYNIFNLMNFSNLSYYKHLCGEYNTSSAFATYIASLAIKNQSLPSYFNLSNKPIDKVHKVLVYNHFQNTNHSLVLLNKC